MLPPFRLGIGGPIAGGRQYIPWIHAEDVVGMMLAALGDERWERTGQRHRARCPSPTATSPARWARALHRPALLPVPGLALRALYGDMAEIVTAGARVVPAKPLMLGYQHRHPDLDEALRSALSR